MSTNKRTYERFPFNHVAQCALVDRPDESFDINIVDVGPQGLGFVSNVSLQVGKEVHVIFNQDTGELDKFRAGVCWVQPNSENSTYRIGVKILDSVHDNVERFARFYFKYLLPGEDTRKKILILNADKALIQLLQQELVQYGYDVICAFDGEDGFSKYLTERPHMVVLDFVLPKLKGYAVCRNIRRLQNDQVTPIIMLVGKRKDIDQMVDEDIGIQKYFVKPVIMDRFLSEVNRIMAESKQ